MNVFNIIKDSVQFSEANPIESPIGFNAHKKSFHHKHNLSKPTCIDSSTAKKVNYKNDFEESASKTTQQTLVSFP